MGLKILFFGLWIIFLICLSACCDKVEANIYCNIETHMNNETYLVCKEDKHDEKISRLHSKVCK